MTSYDAVIVGSGHNALITAAYLARDGWSVLVLERNDRPGGLVRTEELTDPASCTTRTQRHTHYW